jgi:activating signal cointegrator complex subunit 3
MQVAFRTNENILVCAPTGAGKTNIAMIAVLHEIGQHIDSTGKIAKDDFKVVYVAPMKALAAEMTKTFGNRLQALGIRVGSSFRTSRARSTDRLYVPTNAEWPQY